MSASAPPSMPTLNGSLRDDSAIDKSWDRVVSDYKTFHDIRTQGGTVSDLPVFPTAQNGPETTHTNRDAKPETNGAVQEAFPSGVATNGMNASETSGDVDDIPVSIGARDGSAGDESKPGPTSVAATQASQSDGQGTGPSDTNMPPVPSLFPPQAVLGGADDSMKKLLMSWYYAGYYTGLYEGEQKALQRQQQGKHDQRQDGEASQSNTREEESRPDVV